MRPCIIGMNNPYSDNPKHSLFPHPTQSAGYRLWKLLNNRTGVTRGQYVRAFDRRNLVTGTWVRENALVNYAGMHAGLRGRVVLLLGEEVRKVVGVQKELIMPTVLDGVTYRQLTHPSGLCRWYNDPVCAGMAAMLLEELYEGWRTRQ